MVYPDVVCAKEIRKHHHAKWEKWTHPFESDHKIVCVYGFQKAKFLDWKIPFSNVIYGSNTTSTREERLVFLSRRLFRV